MSTVFHNGELQVQHQFGVSEDANALEGMIKDKLPPAAIRFLPAFDFVLATSIDREGQVWTTFLTGPKGFVSVPSVSTLLLAPRDEQTFLTNIDTNDTVGLLFINFQARVRLRINGRIKKTPAGLVVEIAQSYFNCPKYIQARAPVGSRENKSHTVYGISSLSKEHRDIIHKADTFFISSYAPGQGADASHRGGHPGFVEMVNDRQLRWPDYPGNNLYNTLGNLQVDAHCGLLFIDFDDNRILQMTGTAKLLSHDDRHVVEFYLIALNDISDATPFHWEFLNYSPYNP